jgi:hypothetical protein
MNTLIRGTVLAVIAAVTIGCGTETVPTAPTLETSFTYATTVTANGAAARTFSTYDTGTITATLTNVTPAVALGLGIGIPRSDGGGCLLTTSVEATSSSTPQIVLRADSASTYCLKVYDVGRVTERAEFSVTVTHQ